MKHFNLVSEQNLSVFTSLSRVFLPFLLWVLPSLLAAQQVVVFDTDILGNPANAGNTMQQNFLLAINNAGDGGEIIFSAREYSIRNRIRVDRQVTFTGVGEITSDTGVGNVSTRFVFEAGGTNNGFFLANNNIRFRNLEISGSGNNTNISFNLGIFTGFIFENLNINNCEYGLYGNNGSGFVARHVTFRYGFRGYGNSRDNRSSETPQIQIDKCRFIPNDPTRTRSRAISIDAGNDEYPIIWDQNGLIIENSIFEDGGFASSKCKNFIIRNNTFIKSDFWDSMIHLEEFSEDAEIKDNTFQFIKSGGVVEAGNIQACRALLIDGNRVSGPYSYFYSGGEQQQITITNNDLSAGTITDSRQRVINIYGVCGNRDITISGNGITEEISVSREAAYQSTIAINEPSAIVGGNVVPGCAPVIAPGTYVIQNMLEKDLLEVVTGRQRITKSTGTGIGKLWEFTYIWPVYYNIRNIQSNTYLEVLNGALGQDVDAQNFRDERYAEHGSYDALQRKPVWVLNREDDGTFSLLPGGNETSTMLRVAAGNPDIRVVLAKTPDRSLLPRTSGDKFRVVVEDSIDNESNPDTTVVVAPSLVYDFNTLTAPVSIPSGTANNISTTLFPAPSPDGGTARTKTAPNVGGGLFALDQEAALGNSFQFKGIAPNNGVPGQNTIHKFQMFGYRPGKVSHITFKLRLDGGNSGFWYFEQGSGASFSLNGSTNNTHVFAGLRFGFGTDNSILTTMRNGSSFPASSQILALNQKSTNYNVEMFGNNNPVPETYQKNGIRTLAPNTLDLWVNGILVGEALPKNPAFANDTNIDSWMFYGESSTGNQAVIYVDDITYNNQLPNAPEPPTSFVVGTCTYPIADFTEAQSIAAVSPVSFADFYRNNSSYVIGIATGVRLDGKGGVWELHSDCTIKPIRRTGQGDNISLLPSIRGVDTKFGWHYQPHSISADGKFVFADAINDSGFTHPRGWRVAPGTVIPVKFSMGSPFYGRIFGIAGSIECENLHVETFAGNYFVVKCNDGIQSQSIDLVALKAETGNVDLQLLTIFPNPLHGRGIVQFDLGAKAVDYNVTLVDAQGGNVRMLESGRAAGTRMVALDSKGMAAGMYFVHLSTTIGQQTKKVVIIP